MAHIAKYKAAAVGKLCAHYNRWDGIDNSDASRENIDKARTHLNYTVGVYEKGGELRVGKVRGTASWATVKGRIDAVNEAAKAEGKRATRKDAVVMADMVVTLPRNVRGRDAQRFFEETYVYIAERVGVGNMMGGYVHVDEKTPHMHVPFTPILDGRFNYKKLCDRRFYQTFHEGLGDRLERRMGYRPEIELAEDRKAEKALSGVDQKDLDAARAAIAKPAEERAERIMAAARERAAAMIDEAEKRKAEIDEQERAAMDRLHGLERRQREEQRRLERLRRRADEVAGRVDELRAVAADVRGYEDASRGGKREILARISSRCDSLRERVVEAASGLKKLLRELESDIEFLRVQAARRESAKARRKPQDALSRARAASAAMRSGSVPQPPRSYRGRAR